MFIQMLNLRAVCHLITSLWFPLNIIIQITEFIHHFHHSTFITVRGFIYLIYL